MAGFGFKITKKMSQKATILNAEWNKSAYNFSMSTNQTQKRTKKKIHKFNMGMQYLFSLVRIETLCVQKVFFFSLVNQ